MSAQRDVTEPVNVDQLAGELAGRAGVDRAIVRARYDEETWLPTLVAADDVDQETLDACLADHVPVWPEPVPDSIDALADGIQTASTLEELQAALAGLPDILRDMNERRR